MNSTTNSNSNSNSNSNTNRLSQHHRSALHTVNEEDSSRPVSSSSAYHPTEPSKRSSVAKFNESPIGQQHQQTQQNRRSTCLPGVTLQDYRRYSSGASNYQDDDDNKHRRMSREDALAEAEAKLNGYSKYLSPAPHQQSTSTSRHTSLRPSHVFNNNNKLMPVEDMSSQKQNRRLSEPNARAYQRHSDNYSSYHQQPPPPPSHQHHQQDYQKRRSFNAATTSSGSNNGQVFNKRTSLQLSSSSSGMEGLMDSTRRTNSKPTHLFVDVNKSDNRRSRNFNNDWRACK